MKHEEAVNNAAAADMIRRCANGLIVYASALAVKGMEDIVEDMRWLTNWITEFWLTDIDGENWLEIREGYTNSFRQAVLEAEHARQARPLTEQMRRDILAGLEIHAHELDMMGEHDAFADWCHELCGELPAAWETNCGHSCRRPDAGGLELQMP